MRINLSLVVVLLLQTITYQANAYVAETPDPISGNSRDSVDQLTPSDVYARASLIRDELDLFSFEMGKDPVVQKEFKVINAAPREVYFQALSLFKKVNELSYEHLRSVGKQPIAPEGKIKPYHVWQVLDSALVRLLQIKRKLGFTTKLKEKKQDLNITPSDVFANIIQANRTVDTLLEKKIQASDIFEHVTLAIAYTERLSDKLGDTSSIPQAPELERGKKNIDIYQKILSIFGQISKIAELSNIAILELKEQSDLGSVNTTDVFNLSALLVSEVAHFYNLSKITEPPAQAFYPGSKFPSHVYQRLGVLEIQLKNLTKQVERNRNWANQHEVGH